MQVNLITHFIVYFVFYHNVIAELKDHISTLTSKLNQSPPAATYQLTSSSSTPPAAAPSGANTPSNALPAPTVSTRQDSARKFNVVLFGVEESSKGTMRLEREKSDINNTAGILSDLDNSVQSHSIRDTIRLGKYKPSRRPRILITLNRSSEVTSILSKRSQVKLPYVQQTTFND